MTTSDRPYLAMREYPLHRSLSRAVPVLWLLDAAPGVFWKLGWLGEDFREVAIVQYGLSGRGVMFAQPPSIGISDNVDYWSTGVAIIHFIPEEFLHARNN